MSYIPHVGYPPLLLVLPVLLEKVRLALLLGLSTKMWDQKHSSAAGRRAVWERWRNGDMENRSESINYIKSLCYFSSTNGYTKYFNSRLDGVGGKTLYCMYWMDYSRPQRGGGSCLSHLRVCDVLCAVFDMEFCRFFSYIHQP